MTKNNKCDLRLRVSREVRVQRTLNVTYPSCPGSKRELLVISFGLLAVVKPQPTLLLRMEAFEVPYDM